MKSYPIHDTNLAECMFRFISQDDVFADFCFAQMKSNLSVAEYCLLNIEDFRKFCETNYGFTIDETMPAI